MFTRDLNDLNINSIVIEVVVVTGDLSYLIMMIVGNRIVHYKRSLSWNQINQCFYELNLLVCGGFGVVIEVWLHLVERSCVLLVTF